jgi:hypothetical protein
MRPMPSRADRAGSEVSLRTRLYRATVSAAFAAWFRSIIYAIRRLGQERNATARWWPPSPVPAGENRREEHPRYGEGAALEQGDCATTVRPSPKPIIRRMAGIVKFRQLRILSPTSISLASCSPRPPQAVDSRLASNCVHRASEGGVRRRPDARAALRRPRCLRRRAERGYHSSAPGRPRPRMVLIRARRVDFLYRYRHRQRCWTGRVELIHVFPDVGPALPGRPAWRDTQQSVLPGRQRTSPAARLSGGSMRRS